MLLTLDDPCFLLCGQFIINFMDNLLLEQHICTVQFDKVLKNNFHIIRDVCLYKRNPSNAKAAPSAQELLRQSGRSCNLFLKFCFRCNLLFPFFRATGSLSSRESWHGWPSGSTPWVTSRSTSLPSRPGIAVRRGTARDGGGGEREATDWRTNKEVLNAL